MENHLSPPGDFRRYAAMESHPNIQSLLDATDWVDAICTCRDPTSKRLALYLCAKAVLPYWESRFERDDSMQSLIRRMSSAATSPTPENDALLKAAIPKRHRRHWDLSPAPGFFDENYSDCPADFAGDSIFYAACAMLNDPIYDGDDSSAFETALECFARLFAERDTEYDDNTDYQNLANKHLRKRILENLAKFAA